MLNIKVKTTETKIKLGLGLNKAELDEFEEYPLDIYRPCSCPLDKILCGYGNKGAVFFNNLSTTSKIPNKCEYYLEQMVDSKIKCNLPNTLKFMVET